jgi:hypothetical protein
MFSLLTKARADIEIPGATVCAIRYWKTYYDYAYHADVQKCVSKEVVCGSDEKSEC